MDRTTNVNDNKTSLTPSQQPYNVATLSGYASVTSSLPGSGAVTPRTPAFVPAEVGERTALLSGNIGDAEEAIQTGSGGECSRSRVRRGTTGGTALKPSPGVEAFTERMEHRSVYALGRVHSMLVWVYVVAVLRQVVGSHALI